MWVFVVFFFKQKTAYEMRISDWSSDVCSSDLHAQICGHWPEDAAAPLDDQCPAGQGVIRDWNHHGYVQTERNVRFLADDIVSAWKQIGDGNAVIPLSGDFDVDFRNAWVPGPVSHPIPTISNCRSEEHTSELQSLMRISY